MEPIIYFLIKIVNGRPEICSRFFDNYEEANAYCKQTECVCKIVKEEEDTDASSTNK